MFFFRPSFSPLPAPLLPLKKKKKRMIVLFAPFPPPFVTQKFLKKWKYIEESSKYVCSSILFFENNDVLLLFFLKTNVLSLFFSKRTTFFVDKSGSSLRKQHIYLTLLFFGKELKNNRRTIIQTILLFPQFWPICFFGFWTLVEQLPNSCYHWFLFSFQLLHALQMQTAHTRGAFF